MTRRVLVSHKLPTLRSGNAELDRWVEQYLQAHVSQVFDQIAWLVGEEGEFDATLSGSDTPGTYEVHTHRSWYYRTGDIVFATIDIILASSITGGGAGTAQLSGLPLEKVVGGSGENSTWCVYAEGVNLSGVQLVGNQGSGSSSPTIGLNEVNDDAAASGLAIGSFSANDRVIVTGFYRTTGERSA